MPTVFSHPAPVLALAALLGGRLSTRMLLFGILCAVLPDATSSASGSASAMPTRSGTGGFPIPSRLPCSWAVPASEWPRCSCAVHASWDSPSASGRLKPYPAGRNDQRRTRRSRVLAFDQPGTSATGALSGFAVRLKGSCRNGGSPSCSQNCAGYGSVSGCHSRRLVFREEPYACHPPEITPIPLWRISQNGVTPIATITHGTLSIRKLNAIKGMPHTEHPRPAPCRDYR